MTRKGSQFLKDMPARYGLVSRSFHWIMAYLLLWQFLMLIGWGVLGEGEVMRTLMQFGPAHGTVGILVFVLLLPRALWALANRRSRPVADPTPLGWMARAVHGLFYILMLVVPAVAIVRTYGSGKGLELWGAQLFPATGQKTEWLIQPADLLHGPLAWTLAALMLGHILMALFHGIVRRDGTLSRMAGPMRVQA